MNDWIATIAVVVFALAVVFVIYRIRPASQFDAERPAFCLLPKFLVPMEIPEQISGSSNPLDGLDQRLSPLGFRLERSSDDSATFKRGSVMGDISVKLSKVQLVFPLPLQGKVDVLVRYGFVAAFDTGDLWVLAGDVRRHVQ